MHYSQEIMRQALDALASACAREPGMKSVLAKASQLSGHRNCKLEAAASATFSHTSKVHSKRSCSASCSQGSLGAHVPRLPRRCPSSLVGPCPASRPSCRHCLRAPCQTRAQCTPTTLTKRFIGPSSGLRAAGCGGLQAIWRGWFLSLPVLQQLLQVSSIRVWTLVAFRINALFCFQSSGPQL